MNTSIEKFADYIKPYLLQEVAIKLGDKIIRRGKLQIFQMHQHYAKLTLVDGERTRLYDVPYPYDIVVEHNTTKLSYNPLEFLNFGELDFQVKLLDSSKQAKIYGKVLEILPLSEAE